MIARVNAGALYSTGAASSALTGEIDSAEAFTGARYAGRSLMGRSKAMKLRSECGCAGVRSSGPQ